MARLACGCLLLTVLALCGCDTGSVIRHLPGVGSSVRFLPESGDAPGLVRTSPMRAYRSKDMTEAIGPDAALYLNYGAESMAQADYTLGGQDRTLAIEVFPTDDPQQAAGLFHYFRGKKLRDRGQLVDAGAGAVLDVDRDGRNLYFYKGSAFYKLIYTGPLPAPDLVPLARALAGRVGGDSNPLPGVELISIDGVEPSTAQISAGFLFNYQFLPAGITAQAPGAGPIAEVFLIVHHDEKDATRTMRDYRTYLDLNGVDQGLEYGPRRRIIAYGRDPNQGRVIFTQYDRYVVGVIRPQTYPAGQAMIERIVERIGRR